MGFESERKMLLPLFVFRGDTLAVSDPLSNAPWTESLSKKGIPSCEDTKRIRYLKLIAETARSSLASLVYPVEHAVFAALRTDQTCLGRFDALVNPQITHPPPKDKQ